MYSSVQFVEHANKYSSASVSSESVAEIKQVAQSSLTSATIENELRGLNFATLVSAGGMDFSERYLSNYMEREEIERCVERWLERRGELVEHNPRGFPDFWVKLVVMSTVTKLKIRHFERMLFSPGVINSMLRGYMETKEGRLSGFTLVIAIPER